MRLLSFYPAVLLNSKLDYLTIFVLYLLVRPEDSCSYNFCILEFGSIMLEIITKCIPSPKRLHFTYFILYDKMVFFTKTSLFNNGQN